MKIVAELLDYNGDSMFVAKHRKVFYFVNSQDYFDYESGEYKDYKIGDVFNYDYFLNNHEWSQIFSGKEIKKLVDLL